jgi:Domain of unknown function (DUF4417)/ParB-like nuclease domain
VPAKQQSLKIQRVKLSTLKQHPKNPRKGDVKAIAKSLKKNGQFKPLIVQKSTKFLIDGNHTAQAMSLIGWEEADVVFHDVDDAEALRILLVANRTGDLATYDMEALADVLSTLSDPVGTGYTEEDMQLLISAVKSETDDIDINALVHPQRDEDDDEEMFEDAVFGTEEEIGREEDNSIGGTPEPGGKSGEVEEKNGEFENAEEDLTGAFTLKANPRYDGTGFWEIPKLSKSMLASASDIPSDLRTWIGRRSFDKDEDDVSKTWWLFNYSLHSSAGIPDLKKVILGFYAWDEGFEGWWWNLDKFVAKTINSGIKYAIQPDWSQWSAQPRTLSLWALYKNFYVARYMQEAGIKIIPSITWRHADEKYLREVVLPCYPKGAEVVSVQVQTVAKNATKEDVEALHKTYKIVQDTLKPSKWLVYGGPNGRAMFESLKLGVDYQWIEHSLSVMRAKMPQRKSRDTI